MRGQEKITVTSESNHEHTPSDNDEVATVPDDDHNTDSYPLVGSTSPDSAMAPQPPPLRMPRLEIRLRHQGSTPHRSSAGARNQFECSACSACHRDGGAKLSTDRKLVHHLVLARTSLRLDPTRTSKTSSRTHPQNRRPNQGCVQRLRRIV